MNDSLVDQFVDFIRAQDGDRKINHTNGWNSCAVGEFLQETYGEVDPAVLRTLVGFQASYGDDDFVSHAGAFGDAYPEAHSALNTFSPDTYGELQQLL